MKNYVFLLFILLMLSIGYSSVFVLEGKVPSKPLNMGLISSFDVDDSGDVFVLDAHYKNLLVFDNNGEFKWLYRLKMGRPKDIRIYRDQLYVLDPFRGGICVMDKEANVKKWIFPKTKLYYPSSISIKENIIAISDYGNGRVVVMKKGDETSLYSESMISPSASCIEGDNLSLCDWRSGNIFNYDIYSGRFISSFGGTGIDKKLFFHPDGIVSKNEYFFISDWGNNNIKVFSKNTKFIMEFYGGKEGFRNPSILRWHNDTLYVLDSYNFIIRKYSIDFSMLKKIHSDDILRKNSN